VSEPYQRRTNDDGSKFYEHPTRTEEVPGPDGKSTIVRPARYVSVTTALGIVDKPALVFWSANLAARRAMANLPQLLVAAFKEDDCGRSAARTEPLGCGTCAACTERWVALFHHGEKERRAREGSAVHDILEWWTKTGEWVYRPRDSWGEYAPTLEQIAPYLRRLQEFVEDFGLTPESWLICECTVFHHGLKYGGTLDGVVRVYPRTKKSAEFCARIARSQEIPWDKVVAEGVLVVVDCKSSEGEDAKVYVEAVLQLTAYRFAETMIPAKDSLIEMPMLATDGAVVLQVRPDGYRFRPVLTDGRSMKAFRAVLDLHRWHSEWGEYSTQVQAFPKPDDWTWQPQTFERATMPGRGLCGCPLCDDPAEPSCSFGGARPPGPHTREVGVDGEPVAKMAAPRKRPSAAAKKAAKAAEDPPARRSSTIASLTPKMSGTGVRHTIDDADIPF
jgi:hypothetical protein